MTRLFGFARQLTDPGAVIATPTITVYLKGTLTPATLYADNNQPPTPLGNPFTGDQYGYWYAYAAPGEYDVQFSGGTPAINPIYTLGDYNLPDATTGWRNVKAFGATSDGVTNDAAAIQAAIDDLPAIGGVVYFPDPLVNYFIGAVPLTIPVNGVWLLGDGGECSIIKYTGAGSAIQNAGSGMRSTCTFSNLQIDLSDAADGAQGIDFTWFSYTRFERLKMDIRGSNKRAFYGIANGLGSGPYYNVFEQCDVHSDNLNGVTTGSVGYYFDMLDNGGSFQGPNANRVFGGRLSGMATPVRLVAGNGCLFEGVDTEGVTQHHYHFGLDIPDATGTATAATIATLTDAGAAWQVNRFINGAVHIVSGTGAGQYRRIAANSATQLTLSYNWQTIPDVTSVYEIFPATAVSNDIQSPRGEGSVGFNPNFVTVEASADSTRVNGGEASSLGLGKIINAVMYRAGDVWRPGSWRDPVGYTFTADAIGANVVDQALTFGGAGAAGIVIPANADIIGISVASSQARVTGTLTVRPTVNGVNKTLSTSLDANATTINFNGQPPEVDQMGAILRLLGASVTTVGFTPPGDLLVTVWAIPRD